MAFKRIIILICFLLMLIITIKAGFSYELDSIEDDYLLLQGDSIKGSFILEGLEENLIISTDFDWISFDKNKNVSLLENTKGFQIYEDNFYIDYFINIPEDADVGIYRTVIEIDDGKETKYLNIKLNVQSKFFYLLFEQIENPNKILYVLIFIFLIIIIFMTMRYFFV